MILKNSCRLCYGSTQETFSRIVLNKYKVKYFRCLDCESLQTEQPYWLDEAYENNIAYIDTGGGRRAIENIATTYAIMKLYTLFNHLDFGGGDGLLCRLCRDIGINSYVHDKFAFPSYAQGFSIPNFQNPDIITAFEVIEHFSDPAREILKLFSLNSTIVLLSSEIYNSQDSDWSYLAPETGQHIFFFSKKSIESLASRQGFNVFFSGNYILFVRKDVYSKTRSTISRVLLSSALKLPLRFFVLSRPNYYADVDSNALRENFSKRSGSHSQKS